jgi:hypothetical protein
MHKLFILSHLRTLGRLTATEFSPALWEEIATRNTLAPSGEGLLFRLPREELKHILGVHCPINRYHSHHKVWTNLMRKASSKHQKPSGTTSKLKRTSIARNAPSPRSAHTPRNHTNRKNRTTA